VLPLNYIYKQDIFDALIKVFVENEKNNKNSRIYYRDIRRKVIQLVSRQISFRDFEVHIEKMVEENILHKDDPTGKRGAKVYFSLTDKAKSKYSLNILGIDEKVKKRKGLYQLLIFYNAYKRRPLLTEKQLGTFLRKVGLSLNNLEKIQDSKQHNNTTLTLFKDLKDIGILGLSRKDSKTKKKTYSYYTVIPGFTVKEFTSYIKKLKKGKDPRPFSTSSPRNHIPFVNYIDYTEEEVADAIDSFRTEGFIKPINEIFPGEMRFDIVDNSLKKLVYDIWFINIIDFHLLIGRLAYKGKPTDEDKEYLASFVGKRKADGIIAIAYSIRQSYKKENNSNEDVKASEAFARNLESYRNSLIQRIIVIYEKVIQENEVARELVEGICASPFLSKISKAG
jgi:hypothetical protein